MQNRKLLPPLNTNITKHSIYVQYTYSNLTHPGSTQACLVLGSTSLTCGNIEQILYLRCFGISEGGMVEFHLSDVTHIKIQSIQLNNCSKGKLVMREIYNRNNILYCPSVGKFRCGDRQMVACRFTQTKKQKKEISDS